MSRFENGNFQLGTEGEKLKSGKNTFTVTIWDNDGNDVTDQYEIVKIPGDLIILNSQLGLQ